MPLSPSIRLLAGFAWALCLGASSPICQGSTPTIAAAISNLAPLGYYPCNESSGGVLAMDAAIGSSLSPGTIVNGATYRTPGGLFGVPSGGYGLELPTGRYLRIPTGNWLHGMGTDQGCWIALKFRLATATSAQIGAFRNADTSNGLLIDFSLNRSPWPDGGNEGGLSMSVSATDAAGKAIVNVYKFDDLRYRNYLWHDLVVRVAGGREGGTPAIVQMWFDGLLLAPAIEERAPGYDFSTVLPLGSTDLVVGGFGANGSYTPVGNGLAVQCIGLGVGPLTDAKVLPLSQTMWYTDADGVRWDALWEPSPTTCFTDVARTIPCGPLPVNSVGPPVRGVTDSSGNGQHLRPNWLSEALQADPAKGCPLLARDESGAYYLKFNNVGQTRRWFGQDIEQYVGMDIQSGGTPKPIIPAMLNVHAVLALSQEALFQATAPRVFSLGTNKEIGSAALPAGRPALATTQNHSRIPPAPFVRSLPSISFCSWMAGADGKRASQSNCVYFVDGAYTTGSTDMVAGLSLNPRFLAGSTVGCMNGGSARYGADGIAGRLYRLGVLGTPWNPVEVGAGYAAYLQRYGVSDPPQAVMVIAGDSITSHEHSTTMEGWQTRLIPNGSPANWRKIAMYVNATPGVRLHGTAGNSLSDYSPIADPDYWYGLTTARTTFLSYLGTNDCLQGVDGALSVADYASLLGAVHAAAPPGMFRGIGMTIPPLIAHYPVDGQDNKALINSFVGSGVFDRVVDTPDYWAVDGIHPSDAGMMQIAAAVNASGVMDDVLPVVGGGACCTAGGCAIRTQALCGGYFAGVDTACTPILCPPCCRVCCRGATCSQTVYSPAACFATGTAGATFVSATGPACGVGSPCCHADYDKVGGPTVTDIFAYITDWFSASPYAKTGGDGTGAPDITNLFAFITGWFAGGCP